MWLYKPILMCLALLLAGCGFRPLYGTQTGSFVLSELSSIQVGPVGGATGVQLHNALHDNLQLGTAIREARYYLTLDYDTANSAQLTAKDSQVGRYTMVLTVRYELIDLISDSSIASGQTSAQASYNVIPDNAYATFVAEEEASSRAARQIGQQLTNLLSLYFTQAQRPGPDIP